VAADRASTVAHLAAWNMRQIQLLERKAEREAGRLERKAGRQVKRLAREAKAAPTWSR
jgi:hypothetical protein